VVAEVPFDAAAVARLVAADRRANPSRYAVVLVSEGARAEGGEAFTRGRVDAVGNPRLGGVGQFLAREIERLEGVRTLDQSLAYLLRAGRPDSFDLLVAKSFGELAAELVLARDCGKLAAVRGGRYAAVDLERVGGPRKQLDVDRFYDRAEYRPRIEHPIGLPVFLH
jgi:6-phosphofructokinase 1